MRLLLVAIAALVAPCAALAHDGGPVLPDAVAALKLGQIYVDYDANPTLSELEADALGRRLAQKPGVYLAVLPASVAQSGLDPNGVARELREQVGRDGLYVVSVAGGIGTWSRSPFDGALSTPARGSLNERLTSVVDSASPYRAPSDGGGPWTWIGLAAAVALLAGVAAAAFATRRRAAAGASSRP